LTGTLRILPDFESLSIAASELIVTNADKAIASRGIFTLALSGGRTPGRTYELIASARYNKRLDWKKIHIFFGDERFVKTDDPRRNEHMIRTILLNNIPIPPANIHSVPDVPNSGDAANIYESEIKSFFMNKSRGFDMVLLGLGEDGHTASIFPGSDALKEGKRWIVKTRNEKDDFDRITMTAPLLNQSSVVLFLVSGSRKSTILRKVMAPEANGDPLPVRLINPYKGKIVWLVDKAAGGMLA
jgi:6-phosphogluconolactonase